MNGFIRRDLSGQEVFRFYLLAVSLFVFPIVQVDYLFFDDNFRSLLEGDELWRDAGRVVVQLFYNALSFSSVTPNVFPLAHFIAIPVVASALQVITQYYFAPCKLADCLVVLPLFFSPTILGILVYQYDGPAVMLGMATVLYAHAYRSEWRGHAWLGPAVLIAVSLSFYQVLLNVLLGLYCVEVTVNIARGSSFGGVARLLARRVIHVVLGGLIYGLTALQFLNTWRSPLLPLDTHWPTVIWARFSQAVESLLLFVNSGNRWLVIVFSTCALLGYLKGATEVYKRGESAIETGALLGLYVMIVPVMAGLVVGCVPLFWVYEPSARVLLGLAPVIFFVFFFSHRFLSALSKKAAWLLAIPLFCMLSFSFMYGRILMTQKELESSILYSLAYDIHSRLELRSVGVIYLVDADTSPVRRPASLPVAVKNPALNYVGGGWHPEGEHYLVMPSQFPYVGITNVIGMSSSDFEKIIDKQRLVNHGLYDIYLSGRNAYIQMKKMNTFSEPEPR